MNDGEPVPGAFILPKIFEKSKLLTLAGVTPAAVDPADRCGVAPNPVPALEKCQF